MTTWDNLLTAALLGTGRRPLQIGDDAPTLLQQIETTDSEQLLLIAGGVMTLFHRAGYVPATDMRALEAPAPAESRVPCSIHIASLLLQLLDHPDANRLLVGEWLLLIEGKKKRIPHVFLPEIMQRVKRDNALLPMVIPVLGERGKWLAAQNPEWDKFLSMKPDAAPAWIQVFLSGEAPTVEAIPKDAEIRESLNNQPMRDSQVLVQLSKYKYVWSEMLIEAFVARVIADHKKKAYVGLDNEVIGLFAASVPRNKIGSMFSRLNAAAGDEKYVFFRALFETLDLRRNMLQELSHE